MTTGFIVEIKQPGIAAHARATPKGFYSGAVISAWHMINLYILDMVRLTVASIVPCGSSVGM